MLETRTQHLNTMVTTETMNNQNNKFPWKINTPVVTSYRKIELERVTLPEVTESQKDKQHVHSLICIFYVEY